VLRHGRRRGHPVARGDPGIVTRVERVAVLVL
jgi:hypothetical protein